MNRFLAASTLILISLMTLNAGQIEIGGPSGLTPAYVNSSTNTGCTGGALSYNPGFTACLNSTNMAATAQGSPNPTGISGSTTGTGITGVANSGNSEAWIDKALATGLFESASNGGYINLGGSSTGVAPVTAPNGVSFSMNSITQNAGTYYASGLADFGNNGSGVAQSGLYTLTVPVGIYDVSSVSTLLNDFWASKTATSLAGAPVATGQSTAVTFEFSTSSNGLTGTTSYETVYLTNGTDIRNSISAATCTSADPTCADVANYASTLAPSDTLTAYNSSTFGGILSGTSNGTISETITSDAVPSTSFSSGVGGALAFSYADVATGNVNVDEQTFNFGSTYANDYLVAIILDNQMYMNSSPGATGGSRDSLAAVTVTQATPEPSTIFLLLTGLGSIGLGTLRRKKS